MVIFVDLVRHEGVQIVSIGATTVDGSKKFHEYLLPTCDIDPMASKVHGITKSTDQTKMFLNSVELEDVVSIKDGLQHFVDFLKQVSEEGNILMVRMMQYLKWSYTTFFYTHFDGFSRSPTTTTSLTR